MPPLWQLLDVAVPLKSHVCEDCAPFMSVPALSPARPESSAGLFSRLGLGCPVPRKPDLCHVVVWPKKFSSGSAGSRVLPLLTGDPSFGGSGSSRLSEGGEGFAPACLVVRPAALLHGIAGRLFPRAPIPSTISPSLRGARQSLFARGRNRLLHARFLRQDPSPITRWGGGGPCSLIFLIMSVCFWAAIPYVLPRSRSTGAREDASRWAFAPRVAGFCYGAASPSVFAFCAILNSVSGGR